MLEGIIAHPTPQGDGSADTLEKQRNAYWAAKAKAAEAAARGDMSLDNQLNNDRANGVYGAEVQKDWEDQVNGVEGDNSVTADASKNYKDPGAVRYDPTGILAQTPLEDMKANNGLQAQAKGSMDYGLSQMMGNRGPQAKENGTLVARDAEGRAGEQDALGLAMKQANGTAPSAAEGQTRDAMGGLMGSLAGSQGSARGLSALNGTGLAGSALGASASNVAQQGAQGRSGEILGGMKGYGDLAGSARANDQSRIGLNDQMSNFNADLNDRWKLGNGQNALNSGKLANEYDLTDQQRYGASMQPAETQLQADQAMAGIQQGAETDKSMIGYSKAQDKRKSDHDLYMGIGGTIVGAAGTAAGGPVGGAAASTAWKVGNS